jgi:hypothetical protein
LNECSIQIQSSTIGPECVVATAPTRVATAARSTIMIGDPAPLRARSGRNPGRGGRVRRPETPKLVAAKRGNDETAGPSTPCNWSTPSSAQGPRRVPRSAPRRPITPPSLSCPSVKNVSLGPPRSGLGHRRGSPAGCITRPIRRIKNTVRLRPKGFAALALAVTYILARCFSLHALASPSRRSQPRGSAHVTSAPGAFGPVGRRATTGTGTRARARAYRAIGGPLRAPINNTNDAAARAHYQSIEASFFA